VWPPVPRPPPAPDVSFANCGLPHFIGGEIKQRDALAVRTSTEVTAIDRAAKRVQLRNLSSGSAGRGEA